ncbi:MAG: hypothetical protein AAF432_03305 [Planctomycetota bacterium]
MSNPLSTWRRTQAGIAVFGVVACAALALWAYRPLDLQSTRIEMDDADVPPVDGLARVPQPLDQSVFDVRLWNPPPVPVVAVEEQSIEQPRRVPLQLDLLAIRSTEHGHTAIVFDRSSDTILEIAVGHTVQQFEVTSVTEREVLLARGNDESVLTLAQPTDGIISELKDVLNVQGGAS